jgi:hypothetical protein
MKMLFILGLVAGASGVTLIAQSKTELQGAWQLIEVTRTGENAGTNTHPQPGLIIFTEKFYSWIRVDSDQPRPEIPADSGKASRAEVVAAWGPFTANSGTYEISGQTLTIHPTIAKDPAVMRTGNAKMFTVVRDGNTLTLTQIRSFRGLIANPTTFKLTRVD